MSTFDLVRAQVLPFAVRCYPDHPVRPITIPSGGRPAMCTDGAGQTLRRAMMAKGAELCHCTAVL